ncbi:MAG: DUF3139 domain-containing protein [Bacillota bacterium]
MKKWRVVALTVMLLVIVGDFFIESYKENALIEDTYSYLQERGYAELVDKEKIATYPRVSIDEDGDAEFSGGYYSFVTFKDEPRMEYVFVYKEGTKEITLLENRGSSEPPLKQF